MEESFKLLTNSQEFVILNYMPLRKAFLILLFTLLFISPQTSLAREKPTGTQSDESATESSRMKKKLELKELIREKKLEFKQMLLEKRNEATEAARQKREELLERLKLIRDEKKKELVIKINENLAELNKKRTEKMSEALDKLSSILNRLVDKIKLASDAGRDTTTATNKALEAQAGIEAAQEAVASQSAKTYTIEIIDEGTLRLTVGQVVSQLKSDLKSVKRLLVEAKQKVSAVIREVARLGFMGKGKRKATPTP